MCDMSHSCVWHRSLICVTWLLHVCGTAHSYVWHDTFICVAWLIHMCDMTYAYVHMPHSYVLHDAFIYVWHDSYVWHDIFIRVTWRIHTCDMTHSYVTWLNHMCDMTHSYVWRDWFVCVTYERVVSLVGMGHVKHMIESYHIWMSHITYEWSTALRAVSFFLSFPSRCASYVINMSESCQWVMSHICMGHVTHISFVYVAWPSICVTWLISMCDMTHSYVTWLIHMCGTEPAVYRAHRLGIVCGTWLIHLVDMTHSYVWHDSFIKQGRPCTVHIIWESQHGCPVCQLSDYRCTYIHIYIYIYVFMYVCIYIHIHTYIYMYMNRCIQIDT